MYGDNSSPPRIFPDFYFAFYCNLAPTQDMHGMYWNLLEFPRTVTQPYAITESWHFLDDSRM